MYTSWKTLPILSEDILSRLWPPASRRRGSVIRNSDAVSLEPLTGAERGELCVIQKARENLGFSCLMRPTQWPGRWIWTFRALSGPCFSHFHRRRKSKKRGVNLLSIYCILGVNLLYVRTGGILMSVRAFCIPLKEAAKRIGVSRITMRKYCRNGSIDARKTPGGHWRVSSLSLELFQPGKKRIDEICRMFEHESA